MGMPVNQLAAKMVRLRLDGETLRDTYERMPYRVLPSDLNLPAGFR